MARYLYLEGASGISGDMTVAALLDLGGSREKLNALFADLHSLGLHYALERKNSYSISGLDFQVFVHGKDADRPYRAPRRILSRKSRKSRASQPRIS